MNTKVRAPERESIFVRALRLQKPSKSDLIKTRTRSIMASGKCAKLTAREARVQPVRARTGSFTSTLRTSSATTVRTCVKPADLRKHIVAVHKFGNT